MVWTSPTKWGEAVSADDPVGCVAAQMLQSRLDAVVHYLPLAAEKYEEDLQYVHQLRVWARRATAALGLCKKLLPHRRLHWLKRQLKRIRSVAKRARDLDVLLLRLKNTTTKDSQHWLKAIRIDREQAQKAILKVNDRLSHDRRLARRVEKFLQRVHRREHGKTGEARLRFGDWADEQLRPVVDRFFDAAPSDSSSLQALHRFRIRAKKLRYAMEPLAAAFPEEFRSKLYPVVENIQDRLGTINDRVTAEADLQRKIEAAGDSAEAGRWRRLQAAERARLEKAVNKFAEWYTPQRLQELREGFTRGRAAK